MPPQPHWYALLPALRVALAELDSPALDRAMVEELFGLSRRAAIRLMARVRPPRPGTANVLKREELLGWLDRLEATRPVTDAVARRRELGARLARAAREAEARTAPVAVPAQEEAAAGWPAGIALPAPGLLTIGFGSGEELLGRVLALAELAASDYPAFQARLATSQGPEKEGQP